MKKKIILSSLLIGSVVSTLPLSFVFNNKNYVAKEDKNNPTNEAIQTINNDESIIFFFIFILSYLS